MPAKKNIFAHFASTVARLVGHPIAFTFALVTIGIWAITGPIFHFSDTWQLIINTGTTIVTFLMVFLIQNTQTRDTEAMQVKLDELICSIKPARNILLDLEELSEEEIEKIRKYYGKLAKKARKQQQSVSKE